MDTDSILSTEEGRLIQRNEKKSRQTLAKLGLKKVEGITRVVLRRPQGVLLIVAKPEVYKSAHSDCYIVFGEAKLEDPNSGFGAQALAAAHAAEARQRAELERQSKAAGGGKSVEDAESGAAGGGAKGPIDPFEGVDEEGTGSKAAAAEAGGAADVDDADVDTTGLDEEDIKTVMRQGNVSKARAVKVLNENDGDIINAIMACT